jgi:hypothetical protein
LYYAWFGKSASPNRILGTDWSSLVREARIIRQAEVATKVGRPA